MQIYELESEDLSGLGGPMGTERTTSNFRKYFETRKGAREFAEKDYEKNGGTVKIKWTKETHREHSGDLSFVMYTIRKVPVMP